MAAALEVKALALLRRLAGLSASWRDGQLEAIRTVVAGGRALVVQRTGWGKSAVYFIATRLLRDRGAGVTLLVSPLLALMRNQIDAAERLGLTARTINSTNRGDWEQVEEELASGAVDLLLISPERLANPRFREQLTAVVAPDSGLLVIDEAHCISDWGHDFRPDYRRVASVLDHMPPGVPLLCTTATANQRVVDDVVHQLGDGLIVSRGTLDRPSLALDVVALPAQSQRMAWLSKALDVLPGTGIIYCLTVHDTERLAAFLSSQGHDAVAYSGGTDNDRRLALEARLLAGGVKALVATSALGMGYDKPDLAFVIHYQSPGSPILYYQQVGRAGRAVDRAYGILLQGIEDADIQNYFIDTAFPSRALAEQVVGLLEHESQSRGVGWLERRVNARRSRLEQLLKILEVEGAVVRAGAGWVRTVRPWTYDQVRVERVNAQRRHEQAVMERYPRAECLMAELRGVLDDASAEPCGRCGRCLDRPLVDVMPLEAHLVAAAESFLRGRSLEIEPRKQWPVGPDASNRKIPEELRVEPGRALARWDSAGWGPSIQKGKYHFGEFADELCEALAQLVEKWAPQPPPQWVTWVPSYRHPELVPSLAREVARRLGLPAVEAVRLAHARAPQKTMENSVQQFGNVHGAFAVDPGAVRAGPVLLVDDMVDSRWTMTVVGAALRQAGSGPVHPLALAVTAGG